MKPQHQRTGVLLVNLGTPDEPTPAAVRRYLAEFLWDRRVVDFPRPLWWLVLNLIILRVRPSKVAKAYASIWWKEGSPLRVISERQAAKLAALINQNQSIQDNYPVEVGMTYGNPSIASAMARLRAKNITRVIVLPMYPQYSSATHASVFDVVSKAVAKQRYVPELHFIGAYFESQTYIDCLANSVREYWQKHGQADKLLMSFHGIPKRYSATGDPYEKHCQCTAARVADALGLTAEQWQLGYQSRFGREEWLKPYMDDILTDWGKQKIGRVDVICPAFSADCLETLEEMAVENKALFQEHGGGDYHYIEALNDRDDHMQALADAIKPYLEIAFD